MAPGHSMLSRTHIVCEFVERLALLSCFPGLLGATILRWQGLIIRHFVWVSCGTFTVWVIALHSTVCL